MQTKEIQFPFITFIILTYEFEVERLIAWANQILVTRFLIFRISLCNNEYYNWLEKTDEYIL